MRSLSLNLFCAEPEPLRRLSSRTYVTVPMQPSTTKADQYLRDRQSRNEERADEYLEVEGVRVFVPRGVFSPNLTLTNSSRQLILPLPK